MAGGRKLSHSQTLQQWWTWCPWGLLQAQGRMSGLWPDGELETALRQFFKVAPSSSRHGETCLGSMSKWLKLSPKSETAAFELSLSDFGSCRTTPNNSVFWYFWLKKDTWLLVSVSFLAPLFIQTIVNLFRVLRSPQHLQFSCAELREYPKTWLFPARNYQGLNSLERPLHWMLNFWISGL